MTILTDGHHHSTLTCSNPWAKWGSKNDRHTPSASPPIVRQLPKTLDANPQKTCRSCRCLEIQRSVVESQGVAGSHTSREPYQDVAQTQACWKLPGYLTSQFSKNASGHFPRRWHVRVFRPGQVHLWCLRPLYPCGFNPCGLLQDRIIHQVSTDLFMNYQS